MLESIHPKIRRNNFLEKYKTFVQGMTFLILRLGLEGAPVYTSFHYFSRVVIWYFVYETGLSLLRDSMLG